MTTTTAQGHPASLEEDRRALGRHFDPAKERLWAKITGLEEELEFLHPQDPDLSNLRKRAVENLQRARACFGHPHLAWLLLHRVDEDLVMLVGHGEVKARALDVVTSFELNISEPAIRARWLGPEGGTKGPLAHAIETLEREDSMDAREVVRAALQRVNAQVDRRFWILSQNVLTSVWSGVLLAAAVGLYVLLLAKLPSTDFAPLASLGNNPAADFIPVMVLGAMGAYVSNLLTREDFLFVRGGPYWRYLFHPIVAKPILSAFAAVFIYAVAQSSLIFSIGSPSPASPALIAFGVPSGVPTAFAYAVLAIVSGFAADKLLREMIDRVLKRLEEKAEKTVKTEEARQAS